MAEVERQLTPSEQTNRLIEMARQVHRGQLEPEPLQIYLQERLTGLEAAVTDFRRKAADQGPDFLEYAQEEYNLVLEHFVLYDDAMEQMALYFEDSDPRHLEAGCRALEEVTPRLFEVLEAYGQIFMSHGPTRFPLLNMLQKVIRSVFRREVSQETAGQVLGQARTEYQSELESSPPDVPLRQEGLSKTVEALEKLEGALHQGFGAQEALKSLDAALMVLQQSHDIEFESRFTKGPTPMPAANVLIHTARGALKGVQPVGSLVQALEGYEGFVARMREEFEDELDTPTPSVVLQEELPRTLEFLDLHDEAVDALRDCLPKLDPEPVGAALKRLEDAVARLHESAQVYHRVAEREGKLVCTQCSRPNPPVNRACEECGAVLPRVLDPQFATSTFQVREGQGLDQDSDEMVMTTHLLKIYEACQAYYDGNMGAEEFLAVMDWAEDLVRMGEAQLKATAEMRLPPEQFEALSEEEKASFQEQRQLYEETRELFFTGLEEFLEGISLMRCYVDDPQREHLTRGGEILWMGAGKIHQVKRLGELVGKLVGGEEEQTPSAPGSEDSVKLN